MNTIEPGGKSFLHSRIVSHVSVPIIPSVENPRGRKVVSLGWSVGMMSTLALCFFLRWLSICYWARSEFGIFRATEEKCSRAISEKVIKTAMSRSP